jgi:Protein of unknown function (DUF1376)/DnaA N-terminal domain
MTAPPPLTPPDCDLRDFRFMPWDVVRFAHSDLVTTATAEEVLAAALLWGAAWHQVPAASLPDDDRVLAQLAGYGRAVAAWLVVKQGALRNFVTCSDGRLYHPVVAEKARDAWDGKLHQRHRTFMAAVRKHNERRAEAERRASPSYEQWEAMGRPTKVTAETTRPALKQDELDLGTEPAPVRARTEPSARPPARAPAHRIAGTVPDEDSRDMGGQSRVTSGKVTRDKGECHAPVTHESPSKGEGQGEGQGEGDSTSENIDSPLPPFAQIAQRLADLAGLRLGSNRARQSAEDQVAEWLDDGIDLERTIVPTVRTVVAKRTTPTRSLKRFDDDVRHNHAKAGKPSTKAPTVNLGPDDDDQRLADLRAALRRRLGPRTYDGWIAPGRFTLNGVGLVITMPSAFMADWTLQNLSRELGEEAGRLNLGSVKITIPEAKGTAS